MNELFEPENIVLRTENVKLSNELKYQQQVIQNLSNSLDREMKKNTKIRNVLREVNTGKITDGIAISHIQMIVGMHR